MGFTNIKVSTNKIIVVFLIAIFFSINVMPSYAIGKKSNSKLFSLEECINVALKNDPNIKISEDLKGISKSRVNQAKSDYFPSLNAGTGYYYQNNSNKRFDNNSYGGTNNSNTNYYQINVGVNQLIWNFGQTTARINMQKYNFESAGYDFDYAVLDTTYRVKMAYFEVLAAIANLDIYERSVRINQLHYDRTQALFEEGLCSKIDVVNAEVYLTDAKIQLLDAENKYQISLVGLSNSMYETGLGDYTIKNTENFHFQRVYHPENEIKVSNKKKKGEDESRDDLDNEQTAVLTSTIEKQDILQDYTFNPSDLTLSDAIESAYNNRPDLKSLQLVVKASEESLKAVKRSYFPSVSAGAGYSFRRNSDYQNSGFNASAGIDIPLVNALDVKYKITEASLYVSIADENVDLSKKNIYFEVQNNYINMKRLEKRIPLMLQKVQQTLENFELADGRYTVGLGNFIELQDAQTNYNNAQLAFVQTVFDYNVSREMLQKSMGVK